MPFHGMPKSIKIRFMAGRKREGLFSAGKERRRHAVPEANENHKNSRENEEY